MLQYSTNTKQQTWWNTVVLDKIKETLFITYMQNLAQLYVTITKYTQTVKVKADVVLSLGRTI